jgi:signal transduction histidine kinase
MALIARRIREGLGDGAAPFAATPRPMERQAERSATLPSGPAAAVEGPKAGVDVAAATDGDADPGWPGLRVVSERDLATLAHELRTPLAAISALAEVIRDQTFGPIGNLKYVEYAGDIHASVGHALDLLEATVSGHPAPPKVVPTDINALILTMASGLQPLAAQSGVALATSLAAGLPPLLVDARTVRQILLNLVANALRHTPPGGEVTLFTAYRVDGPVRVEVRDTGPGISADDLAEIERAFEADRNGLPPEPDRSGLGLPLVRRLAAANGAELGLDTGPGAGTRVFLTFGRDRVTEGF